MNKPTNTQIAENFDLWGEYVDPNQTMTREQFEAMTTEEKLRIISETFGE